MRAETAGEDEFREIWGLGFENQTTRKKCRMGCVREETRVARSPSTRQPRYSVLLYHRLRPLSTVKLHKKVSISAHFVQKILYLYSFLPKIKRKSAKYAGISA
jgi:hypothetical protein